MAEHRFKKGDPVRFVGHYADGINRDRIYRIRDVGVCNMYRVEGYASWIPAHELVPYDTPDTTFKVGDMVVRASAHDDSMAAQKIAEVDGCFIRLMGNYTFEHCELFKKWKRPEEVIVIRTDGDTTKAYLKRGGKVISEAKCRRMKDDEHDLKFAAALSIDRLLPKDNREIVVRDSGYYGAVAVALESPYTLRSDNAVTAGLIMEFFGGKWKDAPTLSCFRNKKYSSFAELRQDFAKHGYTVIELHR